MKNSKFKIKILLVLSTVCLLTSVFCLPARAQSPTNAPADAGFFGSVTSYLTAFNPELEGSLASHAGCFWSGAQWQAGAHLSSSVGLSYKVYKNFGVESETRFADVTGLVASQQFGVNYNVDVHDVRLTGYARGVADLEKDRGSAALGLRAMKLMTTHTATFVDLQVPVEKAARPVLTIGIAILF